MPLPSDVKKRIFISYSHRDRKHLERLTVHLAQYERAGFVDVWSDLRIEAGSKWREDIAAAIAEAQVAVLLVSADFLASKFINEDELPPLLEAANSRGMIILPVIVGACNFRDTIIAHYQAVNDPAKPLNGMDGHRRDMIWMDVASSVKDALGEGAGASGENLHIPSGSNVIEARPSITWRTSQPSSVQDILDYLISKGWHINVMSSQHRYWHLTHPMKPTPIVIAGHLNHLVSKKVMQRIVGMA